MNPLHLIRNWLDAYAASRKLRTQIEVSNTKDLQTTYFVVGGVGVRDEVLVMQQASGVWWPCKLSVRGAEWVAVADEEVLEGVLHRVDK